VGRNVPGELCPQELCPVPLLTRPQPDVQHVISSWPSANSFQSSLKVPTELRKVASGWQWGFQIPESAKRYRFFKLLVGLSSESDEPDVLTS